MAEHRSDAVAGPELPGLGGLDAVGCPVRPAAQARVSISSIIS